ncbi:alpha/beta fold hydrolase [Pseudonocardia benzenivorans]|uniref:Alpha/beta fold hydrolase n=1 Tax=Pseudonocardia benzenivorans TaxID=228005 RepID=A0ABW3VSE8_9PSEU
MTTSTTPEIGQTLDVNGIRTNFHDSGSGSPLLLLHGSGAGVTAWANWSRLIPAFAERHRVVAPDIVGFGYTITPEGFDYVPKEWVAHVVGLLDALGIEKTSIVGNSFGGGLALWLATAYPDRVDRVVLMGSAGVSFPVTDGLDAAWGYEPSLENMNRMIDYFLYDRSIVSADLAEIRYKASLRPGVQESFAAMFPRPLQEASDRLTVPEASLRELPHRALVVHGRQDQVVPLSCSLRIAELIPNADLHVFNKCGHWTQIERAADFVGLVTHFLAQD